TGRAPIGGGTVPELTRMSAECGSGTPSIREPGPIGCWPGSPRRSAARSSTSRRGRSSGSCWLLASIPNCVWTPWRQAASRRSGPSSSRVCLMKTESPRAGSNRPCRAGCSPTIWCASSPNTSEARPRAMEPGRALSTVPSNGAVGVSADGSLDPVRGHRDSVALSAVGGESGDDLDDDHIDADDRDQEQDEQADADDREHPADETETDDGDDSDDEQIERLGSVVADERCSVL